MSVVGVLVTYYATWKVMQPEHRAAHRGLKWLAWITVGVESAYALYIVAVGMVPFVTWGKCAHSQGSLIWVEPRRRTSRQAGT
jgi:hypothetical protein